MRVLSKCRCWTVRSPFPLLLGISFALLLFYWLTSDSFIPNKKFSLDEYSNDITSRHLDGAVVNDNPSGTISHDRRKNLVSVEKQKINVHQGRARLHLIIQFPVLNTSGSPKNSRLITRQNEFTYCLQRNLLNPHVHEIHILCESHEDPLFVKALNLSMDWKLVFHFLGQRMRYKDAFEYASNNLLHKNAMIMNADCYVGKGFEYLDQDILNKKTVYALTRHETRENVRLCDAKDFCGPKSNYIGSHDAWLFRLLIPVSPQLLSNIDYRPNIAGIERVLIFNLRKYERFRVKNPCKILHIVHHHCNRKRNRRERHIQGKRIDHYLNITKLSRGKIVNAPFSGL